MTQKFAFVLLSGFVLLLASVQDGFAQRRFDRLSFRFTDASVPPPYHRSYSIEINEKRILRFTVTNYSETLHQEDITLSEAQWKSLVAKSQKLEKPIAR